LRAFNFNISRESPSALTIACFGLEKEKMKKAIISLLMTLLFLVNTSRGVAMSKNNQLKKAERADDQNVVDSLNKSAAAVVLEPTLTSLPPQLNTSTTMPENTTIVGHQIRSKLEQIQQHQAKFFEEIKTSMESLVCRLGISSFCIKQIESPNDSNSTTTDLNGNGNAQGPSSSTPQLLPPGLTQDLNIFSFRQRK